MRGMCLEMEQNPDALKERDGFLAFIINWDCRGKKESGSSDSPNNNTGQGARGKGGRVFMY